MYRIKYQRKRGIKRALVMLLALVMLASVCFPAMWVSAEEVDGEPVSVEETFKNKLAGLAAQVDSFAGTQDEYNALVGSVDALRAEIAGAEGLDEAVAAELNAQLDTLSGTLLAKKPQELSDPDVPEEPVMSEAAKAYLIQIEECKGQLEALDPSAPDYEDQLETVIEALAAVVENAQMDTSLTEEEHAAILSAADAVLAGSGEASEQPSDFANTAKLENKNGSGSLTIHFVDENGNELNSTKSNNYRVGVLSVDFSTIGSSYPVPGYTYNRAYYIDSSGSEKELNSIRCNYFLGKWNWYINGGSTSLNSEDIIYLEYKEEGPVRVYVYVAGKKWQNNPEFQELIQLYACDANGYFPAGEIKLPASYFTGKQNKDGLINTDSDWNALLDALDNMDPSKLTGTKGVAWSGNDILNFDQNKENKVREYSSQALKAFGQGAGSGSTALFKWDTKNTSYGFEDQSVRYHLDLAFNTNTITFVTGNNGITNPEAGDAQDGTRVDSRTYITGSEIQKPKTLNVPTGYIVEGYYTDETLTTTWNGVGTQLYNDQTVYIKIALADDIGTGSGTLTITGEKFWLDDEGTGLRPDSITVKLQGSTSENGPWTDVETKTVVPNDQEKWLYEFDVSSQPYTHYQVVETPLDNYTVEYDQPEVVFTYPSAGNWDTIKPCDSLSFTTYPKTSTIIAAMKGNHYTVWTYSQLTPGEQSLICQSLKASGWNQVTTSNTTFFYGYGASTNGLIVTEQSVQFTNKSDWSQFKIGSYNKATASASESTITNTLATTNVTITKTVSGNMGDQSKAFTFTYKTEATGTESTFTLKHGESKTLQNLIIGGTLYIKEDTDYTKTVTYIVTDADENKTTITVQEEDGWYQIPVAVNRVITFNNNKNANIDTGVATDSLPYILLMTLAVIGAGALLLNKRRVF